MEHMMASFAQLQAKILVSESAGNEHYHLGCVWQPGLDWL